MSDINDAEARLLEEVLGCDWDLPLPEPATPDFFQQHELCQPQPFPGDLLGSPGMDNLEGFGADTDLSWLLLDSPKDPLTDTMPSSKYGQVWELGGDAGCNWDDAPILADPKSPSSTRTSNSSCQTTTNEKTKKTRKKPTPATSPPKQLPLDDEAERKRKARQERNRENAHNSRQRKKEYLVQLEKKCRTLESENYHLKLENASLRYQIASVYQAVPPPGDQNVAGLPHQTYKSNMTSCSPVFDYGKLDVAPKLPIWPEAKMASVEMHEDQTQAACQQAHMTPDSNILNRAQPSQEVAPMGKQSKSGRDLTAPPGSRKQGGGKRSMAQKNKALDLDVSSGGIDVPVPMGKKQKLTSIATCVALLCMCAVAMNFGGQSMVKTTDSYREPGRHLQALPGSASDLALTWDVALRGTEMTETKVNGCPRSDAYTQSAPPKYTVQFPPYEAIESSALGKLKELGPLAVLLSETDTHISNRRLLPNTKGWSNFTELVNGVFSSSGFLIPGICKEEFRFDASLVKDMDAARKKVQRHLFALTTYKRQSVGAIPLPPGENWKEDDGGFTFGGKNMGYGDATDSGIIVSLFLPIQNHMQQTGILTAVHSIYVVVLKPTATYWTYSCPLTVPIYA